MESLQQDVRFAVRQLLRNRGFAAVAVLTLALGIGANTAIFSIVDAVMFRALPYPEPDRLVNIWNSWEGSPQADLSPAEYFDYADQVEAFASMGVYATAAVNLTSTDVPQRIPAGLLSAGVLRTLGVRPALGRTFNAEDDAPGAAGVVILTDGLWRRHFGANPDIVGRQIIVNGEATTVVGVMPPGFRLPDDFATDQPAELFATLNLDPTRVQNRGSHFLHGIARLRPGVTLSQAQAGIRAVAAGFVRQFPDDYPADMRFTATVAPLREDIVGPVRPALLVLLGAVGVVLLIACANVANLMLSRADGRRREFAVRAALGAGRARIARQLLVEGMVLSLAGGALGLLFATWGGNAIVALQPPDIPRLHEVGLDLRVLGFTTLASLATGLFFSLAPMMLAWRRELTQGLREGRTGVTAGASGARFRSVLTVAEIALALVLLTAATLLTRSLVAMYRVDPGYRTENLLTFRLSLPAAGYAGESEVIGFYSQMLERLRSIPGVSTAGAVSNLPLSSELGDLNFEIEGQPVPEGDVSPRADWQVVTPGYFATMGMQLLRGRGIEESDRADAPGVVVISESVARTYWPNEDPLGERFKLGGEAGPGWVTVIGIMRDVRHASLSAEPNPEMYLSYPQFRFWNGGSVVRSLTVVLRAVGEPTRLAGAVRSEVSALDPNLPISELQTMEAVVASSVARPRFLMSLIGAFAVVAMLLAAVGVYGVLAFSVSRRTREIGIRVALGARSSEVAASVIEQGMKLALAGILIGLVAALASTRLLSSLLFGVSPTDPATLIAVSALLASVAWIACYVPARRATRVDPMIALRAE